MALLAATETNAAEESDSASSHSHTVESSCMSLHHCTEEIGIKSDIVAI